MTGELKRLGGVGVLLSTWALRDDRSAKQLRDHLKGFVDADDRLLVVEMLASNWGGTNLINNTDINTI